MTVKQLSFGQFSILYAGFGDGLVVTTSRSGIADLRASGGKLSDDSDFEQAKDAAGLPDDNAGFLYVNVQEALELGTSYAEFWLTLPAPAEVDANARPLRSFLTYSSQDGDESRFAGFLRIE